MKSIVLISAISFASLAFADVDWRLEMAIGNYTNFEIVAHIEIESATVVREDAIYTLFEVQARMIESFRGDLGEKLCYVAQHENPVRSYPTPGERQIASFRGATSDRGCFGLETGSVIPDEEKYLNLMRALREADE